MVYRNFGIQSLPYTGYTLNNYGGSKISLPVPPSQYIYSHFKHVKGVPSNEDVGGVSIDKLKILDVLIEQLTQLKKKADPIYGNSGPISEDRINALIEKYEKEIRSAQAAHQALPYRPQPTSPSGVLFNLVA